MPLHINISLLTAILLSFFSYSDDYDDYNYSSFTYTIPLHDDSIVASRQIANLIDAEMQNHLMEENILFPRLDYNFYKVINEQYLDSKDSISYIQSIPQDIADSLVRMNKHYLVLVYDLNERDDPDKVNPMNIISKIPVSVPGVGMVNPSNLFSHPFGLNDIDSLRYKLSIINLRDNKSVLDKTYELPDESLCDDEIQDCIIEQHLSFSSNFISKTTPSGAQGRDNVMVKSKIDFIITSTLDTLPSEKITLLHASTIKARNLNLIGAGLVLTGGVVSLFSVKSYPEHPSLAISIIGRTTMTTGTLFGLLGLRETAFSFAEQAQLYRFMRTKDVAVIFGGVALAASSWGIIYNIIHLENRRDPRSIPPTYKIIIPVVSIGFNTASVLFSLGTTTMAKRLIDIELNKGR